MAIDATTLPDFVRVIEGKQRQLPEQYLTQRNFDQEPRSELIRNNQSPIWDLRLGMKRSDTGRFFAWFRRNGGVTPFTIPLRVEGGTFDQTVTFTERPLNPESEPNSGWQIYQCEIQANEITDALTGATTEEEDFYFEFSEHNLWSYVINFELPKI